MKTNILKFVHSFLLGFIIIKNIFKAIEKNKIILHYHLYIFRSPNTFKTPVFYLVCVFSLTFHPKLKVRKYLPSKLCCSALEIAIEFEWEYGDVCIPPLIFVDVELYFHSLQLSTSAKWEY